MWLQEVPTHRYCVYRCLPTEGQAPTGSKCLQEVSAYRYLSTGRMNQKETVHRKSLPTGDFYLQEVSFCMKSIRYMHAQGDWYCVNSTLPSFLTFSCSKVGSNWISPDSLMVQVTAQTRHFIGKPASTIAMQAALIAHESNWAVQENMHVLSLNGPKHNSLPRMVCTSLRNVRFQTGGARIHQVSNYLICRIGWHESAQMKFTLFLFFI